MAKTNPVKKYDTVVKVAKVGSDVVRAINPMAVITETIEYLRTREEEQTKREHIWSKRDVLVTALNNEKDVLLAYFDYRFKERKATLEQFYDILQRASRSGDGDQLQVALTGILGIIQENPLKDFAEFKKNMSNPDFVIEL
ncbi:MAG: hypothetical protein D6711_13890 [Chloroflexi bacterium]|nr:MAG: hypothetical protein D6711_13890 [Chloroflexota bacterium]